MPRAIQRACIECHRRKIKCDKSSPCSYCVKVKIQCRYRPTRPSQQAAGNSTIGDENLTARIEGIERVLQSIQQDLSQIRQLVQPAASRSGVIPETNEHEQEYHGRDEILTSNESHPNEVRFGF